MADILGDQQRQPVLALGRLSWPLRRIEQMVRPTPSWPGERAAAKAGASLLIPYDLGSALRAMRVRSRQGLPGPALRRPQIEDPAATREALPELLDRYKTGGFAPSSILSVVEIVGREHVSGASTLARSMSKWRLNRPPP
jgi:hypothetical protein